MNPEIQEVSLQEQYEISGGDWYDSGIGMLEAICFIAGML